VSELSSKRCRYDYEHEIGQDDVDEKTLRHPPIPCAFEPRVYRGQVGLQTDNINFSG
jgi:hypothetical protein